MTDKRSTITSMRIGLNSAMNSAMLSCRKAAEYSSQAMDSDLGFAEKVRLWMHLRMCKWCRRNEQQLATIRKVISRWAIVPENLESDSLTTLDATAREKMEKAIRDTENE